jgi:hypothetical protein
LDLLALGALRPASTNLRRQWSLHKTVLSAFLPTMALKLDAASTTKYPLD